MLTNLDPANSHFVAQLNDIQARMDRAQKQITSGLRITTPDDAPDQISELLSARAALQSTQQTNANLGRVKTEADAAEKALSQASSAFERVRVLGTEGANFTQSADTRATIAAEVGTVLE